MRSETETAGDRVWEQVLRAASVSLGSAALQHSGGIEHHTLHLRGKDIPPQYSYRTDAGAVFLSDSSLLWMNTKSMNVSALLDVMNTLLEKRLTVRNLFLKLLFLADSL